jgi:hypothetical protein
MVHESDQISKQNTSATIFYKYNLVRKEELIPSLYSQRQTVAKREGLSNTAVTGLFRCGKIERLILQILLCVEKYQLMRAH